MPQWYGRLEFALAKCLLVAITVLVFIAAMSRFFGAPVEWSDDMAQLLFVWLCMLGANRAMRLKMHMAMDYSIKRLSRKPRWLVELLNGALMLAFLLTLAWSGYKLTILNWERVFGDSGLSYAWVTIAIPVGCALLAVEVTILMVRSFKTKSPVFFPEKSNDIERAHSQLG